MGILRSKNKIAITKAAITHEGGAKAKTGFLRCLSGEFAGAIFSVGSGGLTLGRNPVSCQIVFHKNSRGISQQHCFVTYNPQTGLYVINDLGSTYGTFSIEKGQIKKGIPAVLAPGDRFYLGKRENLFEVG